MKKNQLFYARKKHRVMKFMRIMKLTALFSIFCVLSLSAKTYSQETKLNIEVIDNNILQVFDEIEKVSEYGFFFKSDQLDLTKQYSMRFKNASIEEIMERILDENSYKYQVIDKTIVISKKQVNFIDQYSKRKIKGTVTDQNKSPLPGASVIVKGTTIGVISDSSGAFELEVPSDNSIISVSFVGMQTQDVAVSGKSQINVSLQEDAFGIEEVVAIGYGTQRKSDMTGAITQVEADELATVSVSNPIQALQGRAAGVAVMTNNAPGSSPTLRIRGSGSINAKNDPLYVVDGFPLMNSDLNDMNPNDIESIEVLKDASSSAIYGSRGANGVVLITTKKGKNGRNDLSVNSYYGIQTPERLVEMLGRDEFINFVNDAYTYSKGTPVYSASNPAPAYNTDWQDAIVRDNAAIQEHSINFEGGKDKTRYMLSGSVFSQDGLLPASGFEKYTLRTNLNHEFKKWLTIGTHLQFSNATQDLRDNPTGNVFRFGWPTMPVNNPDGSWYYSFLDPQHDSYIEGKWNPVADASEVTDQSVRNRILGDVFAEFTLSKNLKFKTNIGIDISNAKRYEYSTSKSAAGLSSGGKGLGGQSYNKMTTKLTENILTYSNIWNDVHRFTATGVYSYQDFMYDALNISGVAFQNDATGAYDMTLADRSSIAYGSTKYGNKLISWTARASYAYNDKYMLTVTGRYDGSSRFGDNNKWGFFPSVGLGWRISQESFLNDNKTISNLKLRASYGVTGNQEISNYSSLPKLSSVYYTYNSALLPGFTESIGNSDLRWERTTQYDLGLDIGLWNNVDISIDYYNRTTNDLLYNVPIPTTSGSSSILDNIGEVKNNGLEFSVSSQVVDRTFKLSLGANVSVNRNEISELYGDVEKILLGTSSNGYARFLEVGKPVNSIYTRESAGIIKTQEQLDAYRKIRATANFGEEMYVDYTDNNSIGTDDYICIGSPEPKFFYGLSANMSYKKFSLDVYGQGAHDYASVAGIDNSAFGSTSVSIGYATSTDSYLMYRENQILNQNYQPTKYAYDRMWSESNPNGTFPRAGAKDVYFSDRTSANWSYFIVKNIKLGYDFSSSIKNVNWIKELTVYLNAQNYISFANHRGYNPENGDTTYPWAKTMIFGINAKF